MATTRDSTVLIAQTCPAPENINIGVTIILVYVDVSNLSGPLQIAVLANTIERKRYKLRICQFASTCTTSMNCLQYYTGVRGVISSFNYDQSAGYNRSEPGYFVST